MDDNKIAKKYQKLEPIEHILKRPNMYIGSPEFMLSDQWILQDNKIVQKDILYSPGLYKIFDEIIVNAHDQTIRDKTVTKIMVEIDKDKNLITVYNDGIGIDVAIHPKEKIYVPELIFGHLRTSTSFEDEEKRIVGGTYGLGAKLTNIFSTYFKVEVGDPIHHKSFSQTYTNNLSNKTIPIIKDYKDKTGYVRISFKPDLKYFNISTMSDDFVNLLKRRVYDIAGLISKQVSVYLDNTKIAISHFSDYVNLFTIDINQSKQVHENCDDTDPTYKEGRWKIILIPSDGTFKQISFVNGIYTSNGGKHVDYIMNRIIKLIKDYIMTKYKTDKVKSQFIKDQFWIFLSSVIENPSFSSQTKDELLTPVEKFGSTCTLSQNLVKKIFQKFDFDLIIQQQIQYMQSVEISKLDVKKKKTIKGIPKLYDANFAGTKKSRDCTLILTEGDSAKTMAISGLSAIPKGNNTYGIFPLKGKLLNVREATHKQIINNEEFKNLKQIIGLETNKVYTKDNIDELRYGSILLMMDADVDGSHIKGLFINMIHYYWPSLLKIDGFIKIFITPVVKVTNKRKQSDTIAFYTLEDYNNWKIKIKDNVVNYQIKYYKGLGTNTNVEAKEYFSNLDKHIINFIWTPPSDGSILLAFAKDKADERKQWLINYDPSDIFDFTKNTFSYDDFIHKELIHFSNYDNIRSIPSVIDGLKPSQRKVLYGCFKRNLTQDVKVAQLVGYISEHTSYHHGEVSLANTIIGMAQTFLGSNNINLLKPVGQFGTRLLGGKDHSSPRYIFTQLEEVTRLIYHKDDDALLNYLDDDGFTIEPEYYVPIIPMLLVNGAEGIGTGYSTYIPKFNPIDIIDNIIDKLNGQKFKLMTPWYKGNKGSIIKKEKNVYVTKGSYQQLDNGDLLINELPITSWTEPYKIFLDNFVSENKEFKSILNNSNETDVDFVIKTNDKDVISKLESSSGDKLVNELEKTFNLARMINLTNMNAHDYQGHIKTYDSTNQIMEEFYTIRLEFYDKRKKYLLAKLDDEIKILNSKVVFITLMISKKLDIFNKKKDDIINILSKHKDLIRLPDEPPYDYLIKMSFYSITKERIDELKSQLDDKKEQYNKLKKQTIEQLWMTDLLKLKEKLITI